MTKTKEIRLADPNDRKRLKKPKRIVNPKQLRLKIMALLKQVRPAYAANITRISPSFIDDCEGDLINCITNRLQRMPSVGRTLK